jgi:hypothetical protein
LVQATFRFFSASFFRWYITDPANLKYESVFCFGNECKHTPRCGRRSAAPRTIIFNTTQGSQSLALGLTLAAASQLLTFVLIVSSDFQNSVFARLTDPQMKATSPAALKGWKNRPLLNG